MEEGIEKGMEKGRKEEAKKAQGNREDSTTLVI